MRARPNEPRLRQPIHDTGIRTRSDPFRHHIGVEEKAHSLTLRAPPRKRLKESPDPRKGDAAKNSARLRVRSDLRSHSSAATMTTVERPFWVTVCGSPDAALSMRSSSLALASATVQVFELSALMAGHSEPERHSRDSDILLGGQGR